MSCYPPCPRACLHSTRPASIQYQQGSYSPSCLQLVLTGCKAQVQRNPTGADTRHTEELSASTRNSALQRRYSKPQKWRVVRPNLLSDFWNSKHVMLYTK